MPNSLASDHVPLIPPSAAHAMIQCATCPESFPYYGVGRKPRQCVDCRRLSRPLPKPERAANDRLRAFLATPGNAIVVQRSGTVCVFVGNAMRQGDDVDALVAASSPTPTAPEA